MTALPCRFVGLVLLAWPMACGAASAQPAKTPRRAAPTSAQRAPPARAEPQPYVVSATRSKLRVVAFSLLGEHPMTATGIAGRAEVVETDLARSQVRMEIDMRSIEASSELFTRLVRSDRVLDVERFPQASFASREIRADERGADHYLLTGDLTLHGVSRPITVTATVERRGDEFITEATFTVVRQDFDIRPGGMLELLVHDDVRVELRVVAVPEQEF